LRVKLKRIKTLTEGQKSRQEKKTIYYKLGMRSETTNNETFIKDSRKKNKHQILNIKT